MSRTNNNSLARLEVQQPFCHQCANTIEMELQNVEAISNIKLYPRDALIVFNFRKAIALSNTLNALSEIGYNEKGESVPGGNKIDRECKCSMSELTRSVA